MARFVRYAVRLGAVAIVAWLGWTLQAWAQDGPHRAGLVVRFGDGTVETRCISFAEPAISGVELLARAGLSALVDYNGGMGGAVCSIEGQGCAFPREDCFCQCRGNTCEYWAYYHWQNGRWLYSDVGASSFQVTDGAVEGWSWGQGNFSSGTEPPSVRFDEICAATVTPAASGVAPANAPAGPAMSPRATPQPDMAGAMGGAAAVATRYASFALFMIILTAGWAWLLGRRKHSPATSDADHKS